LDLYLDLETM